LQAVKLRENFIELYKAGPLTIEKLKAANLAWNDVFEELPIRIQNGNLARYPTTRGLYIATILPKLT
jgi:hypothetical protein